MKILPAVVDDAAEILALQKLAYASEAALYGDETLPPLTQSLEQLRAEFERQVVLKAMVDDPHHEGAIAGSVRAHLREGTCYIGRLIVHPSAQGRGLGTRLMTAIEARFAGAVRYELFTGDRSMRNLRLYEKLGYIRQRVEALNATTTLVFLEKQGQPGPVLETERLILRPMRADDFTALWRIFSDPQVMAAFASEPFDHTQMSDWLGRNLVHQAEHGWGLFSLIHKTQGDLIGDCGLEVMTLPGGAIVAELGYDLRSDVWGQGLATEAASAVRDFAFGPAGLTHLVSLIRSGNDRSRRVAEKVGMTLEATVERWGVPYWRYGLAR